MEILIAMAILKIVWARSKVGPTANGHAHVFLLLLLQYTPWLKFLRPQP